MFSNAQKIPTLRKVINLGVRNKDASYQVENDIEWNQNGRGHKNMLLLPKEDNGATSFNIEFKLTGQNPQPLVEFKTHSLIVKDNKVQINGREIIPHRLCPRLKYNLAVGKRDIVLSIGKRVLEPRGKFPEDQKHAPTAPPGMIFPGVLNIVLSDRDMIEPWTPVRLYAFICGGLSSNMSFSSTNILEVFNKDKGIKTALNNQILFDLKEPHKYVTHNNPVGKSFMIDSNRVCIVNLFAMTREDVFKEIRSIMESDFVGNNPLSRIAIIEFDA